MTDFRLMKLTNLLSKGIFQQRAKKASFARWLEIKQVLINIQKEIAVRDPQYFSQVYWHRGGIL